MSIQAPFPDLNELAAMIGEAGRRLSEIGASEGAAGNISIYIGWPVEPRRLFPHGEPVALPTAVPELAKGALLVTGSGRRLREAIQDPAANLGFVTIDEGGRTGRLYTSPRRLFDRLTSELNSHLAIHRDQVGGAAANFHAVVHAQPFSLTYLSHIPAYRDEAFLNRRLLRWQPEAIVNLPEGLGCLPFLVPGSAELMAATVESLRAHRITIWSKHGVVARSDQSVKRAVDRIEYAETAARYERADLDGGGRGQGLTDEEIRTVARAFGIEQRLF
jgi:rhamnulose-1-phosphate aldolase